MRDFLDGVDDISRELDVKEEGVATAAAGDLHDQLVVMVSDLAKLRALVITSADTAAVIASLRSEKVENRIVHYQGPPARERPPGIWASV
jgi:hypothetical protein